MAHQARSLLDRWTWSARTWFTRSADGFTSRLVEKYGENFYEAWDAREQDLYARLRLSEEGLAPPPGHLALLRRLIGATALALVLVALVLAITRSPTPLVDSIHHNAKPVPQIDDSIANNRRPVMDSAAAAVLPEEVGEEHEAVPGPPLHKPSRSHVYFPRPVSPPRRLAPRISKQAKSLAAEAGRKFHEGEYEAAIGLYREVIQAGAATSETHNNLGCSLFRSSRRGQTAAITQFSIAHELDPGNARVLMNRGFAYFQEQGTTNRQSGCKDIGSAKQLEISARQSPNKPSHRKSAFLDLGDSSQRESIWARSPKRR
jgi:tetratricopeptide (TPR) repeat protein